MSSLSQNLAPMSNRRRSQRVLLRIPIQVTFPGPDKQPVVEKTNTVLVNAHGGLVYMQAKIVLGMQVTLQNPETREEVVCRVAYVNPAPEGKFEVGLEFLKAAPNFWRVAFPPADWNPRTPEITADTF